MASNMIVKNMHQALVLVPTNKKEHLSGAFFKNQNIALFSFRFACICFVYNGFLGDNDFLETNHCNGLCLDSSNCAYLDVKNIENSPFFPPVSKYVLMF